MKLFLSRRFLALELNEKPTPEGIGLKRNITFNAKQ